jgi:hypothetical protein
MQLAPCNACDEIGERRRQARVEYHAAIRSMDELQGLPGFKGAANRADEARTRYLGIREELRKHVEEHG